MRSKPVPFRGEFCIVLTSAYSDQVGYVVERTVDQITVQFKDGLVGKYSIENNSFVRIGGIWWGEEGLKMSIDEKIDVLQDIEKQLPRLEGEDNFPEDHLVPMEVDEWVKQKLFTEQSDDET